jgi:acyl carrier protein
MAIANIREAVIEIIAQSNPDRDPAKIKDEASLTSDLNMDSLEIVNAIMRAEDKLGIEFPEDAADKVETVGDLVKLIEKLVSEQQDESSKNN